MTDITATIDLGQFAYMRPLPIVERRLNTILNAWAVISKSHSDSAFGLSRWQRYLDLNSKGRASKRGGRIFRAVYSGDQQGWDEDTGVCLSPFQTRACALLQAKKNPEILTCVGLPDF